ncbi:hypothetical protein SDC9_134730 [bioreactor metagenome]|uniref:Uncharacterized protein n=1 Tax=bioreactor metagenome TaxID=1076179 RepID=A0A645DDQ9_9ZZZZ
MGNVFAHQHHTFEQVSGLNHLLIACLRQINGFLNGFLGFDCKIVKIHMLFF